MTIRSYAQNFEDVLLRRALRDVRVGFYVDVGAGHPRRNSVTKSFSEAGWRGLNIEPLPAMGALLAADRPEDVTVVAAVSDRDEQTVDLVVVDEWDELSTIAPDRVQELGVEGRRTTTTTVPVVRLDDLVAEHRPTGEVHFLKVDVEGAELEVLRTLDLGRTRPWVVLVEVVAGGRPAASRDQLRELLTSHDYRFVWFDGLNDFYVSGEHPELLDSFGTPVNVTDDFVPAADSDDVVLDLVGDKLGLPTPSAPSEILQRLDALVHDRVEFERRFTEIQSAPDEVARLAQVIVEHELTIEALEQTAFERERMIAWHARETAEFRRRWERREADTHAWRIAAEAERHRLGELIGSTSWRATLPIRVARRPGAYLRKLAQR